MDIQDTQELSFMNIVASLSMESAKTPEVEVEPETYEFTMDDYFETSAQVNDSFQSIQLLCAQVETTEAAMAKMDEAGVDFSDEAVAAINDLAQAIGGISVGAVSVITELSLEAEKEGDEPKKKKGVNMKGIKEQGAKLVKAAKALVKQLGDAIMAQLRKFNNGSKMLQASLKKVHDGISGDITVSGKHYLVGGEKASPSDVTDAANAIVDIAKNPLGKGDEAKIMLLGDAELMVKLGAKAAESRGSMTVGKTESKELKFSESEAKALLKACIGSASGLSKIDYKAIIKAGNELAESEASAADIKAFSAVMKQVTIAAPQNLYKNMSAIGKGFAAAGSKKEEPKKEEGKKDDAKKDDAPKQDNVQEDAPKQDNVQEDGQKQEGGEE